MDTMFVGSHTTILASKDRMTFVIKHGPKKAHRKTFKGESAWSAANRFAWDLGDLTANV